jgi:Family of unknown function (DUF6476)
MQALKVLVGVMGVLIIVGAVVVVVTIVQRMGGGSAAPGFGKASLVLPRGCQVVEMTTAGAKLALRLGDGPDCQAIVIVDPETGRETGRLQPLAQP